MKKAKAKKRADAISAQENKDKFSFDDEIVIGVTRIEKQPKKQTKKKKNNKKNNKVKKVNKNSKNRKQGRIKFIIKWTILLIALMASIIFFMMSPIFNISEIEVIGNEQINTNTIISLSQIQLGENIYKTGSKKIQKSIKENAYIESATIKRVLPSKILINIKERKATYMLEYAGSYAYINNQGYILEISNNPLNVPIIKGYSTDENDIKTGNRLCDEDLKKLETVLKIVEVANGNGIGNLIVSINIQDKQNYVLIMEEGKKTVYLGDASNLSNRILYLKAILEGEKEIEGEVFVNGDLNKENAYFRIKE